LGNLTNGVCARFAGKEVKAWTRDQWAHRRDCQTVSGGWWWSGKRATKPWKKCPVKNAGSRFRK